METYSQYGTMMEGLPSKMSSKQLRISTLDAALELVARSVYKAQLPSGRVIALKKLHRIEAEEPSFDKCFKNEKIKNSQPKAKESKNGDIFSVWNYDGRIAFEDVIEATENFDFRYCIGTGGYGSVYKAQLPSGRLIALKKLHKMEAEEPSFDKCFKNEVQLGLQENNGVKKLFKLPFNLVKIVSCCLAFASA
ncbi:hypothetical protein GH714_031946 [Hevea brasiliensis]|uniref:non-specific serine/threonine protein kinase n=1 Tax=Hevea brasiliensis TaxID=3981 RepID=A0A6A6N7V8_HEVBR|nr:hypothetical protein GH714_031946 [Hevea brasiliensis]